MARVLTNENNYYNIADTIRQMKNVNTTYKPREMAHALKDIYSNEVEGVPPLTFESNGMDLLDYRIDGASGGVGARTNNLFDKTKTNRKLNQAKNADGTMNYSTVSSNFFDYYIPVEPNTQYTITDERYAPSRIYFFKSDKTWIDRSELAPGDAYPKKRVFTTPANCYYIQFQESKDKMMNENTLMLNEGSTALPYEPYGYKVPVMVEGKNLAKNNYITISSSLSDLIVEKIGEFIHVSATNNTANPVPYVISKDNNFHAGTYDIVNNSDTMIACDYKDENNNLIGNTVESNTVKSFIFPESAQRGLNIYKAISSGVHIDNYFQVMIVKHGDDTDTYEPYIEPTTTNIYLDEPIEENESISLSDTNVDIPTIDGTNVISIDTTVQPSNVYIQAPKDTPKMVEARERLEVI